MQRISDTITSIFHIAVEKDRPVVCSSGDSAIAWSDTFGLGWRFGISYNSFEWFAKVRLYLDHNHSHTEQDHANVTVSLRDTVDQVADGFKERMATIKDFGHGQPVLLGSWSLSDLALHPYVSLTLTNTKARFPQPVSDPLCSASLAIRQSMKSGDFVDTKFYVFSAKRPGKPAGKPRVVYANSDCIGLVLPKSTLGAKRENELAPAFLANMTGDDHINERSVLHEYPYEQDSDLDEEEEDSDNIGVGRNSVPSGGSQMPGSSSPLFPYSTQGDETPVEPPAYSVSTCRMILVKGVAYKTWLVYIYYCYSGQVSFLPLKSAQKSSRDRPAEDPVQLPGCSPKSMYRLAVSLNDEKLKEFAFRAIKEGLSVDNVVEETFSWFTAQYPDVLQHEVDMVVSNRKSLEVSSALSHQVKAMSLGEKPWAYEVLNKIMERLNA